MDPRSECKPELFEYVDYEEDDESPHLRMELRRQYGRLGHHSFTDQSDHLGKPITCFLHPKLTPSKLLEHLNRWGVSEAEIVHWLRRLRQVRAGHEVLADHVAADHAYAVDMMGK